MSSNFDTRVVIWGMDNNITLQEIPDLLSLDYCITIDYLENFELNRHDKTLENGWTSTDGEPISIKQLEINGHEINYIYAMGSYEVPDSRFKAIIDGRPLPRQHRVFNKSIKSVFFEINARVYCAIEVSVSQESRVRSVLFGQGYKNKKEQWGRVSYKDLPQYHLDSRFFYWIFSKRGQQLSVKLGEEIEYLISILDVSAVSQLSERNVHDSRTEGPDVLGSVSTLSGLGINQAVYEGGFHLVLNDLHLVCRLTEDSTCTFDSLRSNFVNGDEVTPAINNFPLFAIKVYTLLIPRLVSSFHQASMVGGNWTITQEIDQRKKWALLAVKALLVDNNIQLEELEELYTD